MAHYEREKDSTLSPGCLAIEYIKKSYIRMFPEYAMAFLILAVYYILVFGKEIHYIMIKGFWEFFMLNSIGMELYVNGISWYVSVLIVASYCVYFMLHKFKDTYVYFLAPLIFGIIYVCIYRNIGHIDVVQSRHFIIWDGFWRGIAEINLGIISYKIYKI